MLPVGCGAPPNPPPNPPRPPAFGPCICAPLACRFHVTVFNPAVFVPSNRATVSPAALRTVIRGAPPVTGAASRYVMAAPAGTRSPRHMRWARGSEPTGRSPYCSATVGLKSTADADSAAGVNCCNGETSRICTPRPCVPAISSRSRGCTCRSYTGTVGRLVSSMNQVAPLSSEAYTPSSVPAYSSDALNGSSRTTYTVFGRPTARPAAIERNVFPKSFDTYTYGAKSLSRWLSNDTYTVAESDGLASILLTCVKGGTPTNRALRSSHEPPSFFVSHTFPSFVPTYNTPALNGDSAMVTIVAFSSAPVASRVMPPVASTAGLPSISKPVVMRMRDSSRDDRSGEIA